MPVVKRENITLNPVAMDGVVDASMSVVIGKDQGWNQNCMRVFRLGPGGNTPHHQHDWEHVNYVTSGKGRLQIADQIHELKQGDYAFVPPNTDHQFSNPYDDNFEFICIVPEKGAY